MAKNTKGAPKRAPAKNTPKNPPKAAASASLTRCAPAFQILRQFLVRHLASKGTPTTEIAKALDISRSFAIKQAVMPLKARSAPEKRILKLAMAHELPVARAGLKMLLTNEDIVTTLAGGEREKLGPLAERRAKRAKQEEKQSAKAKTPAKAKANPAPKAKLKRAAAEIKAKTKTPEPVAAKPKAKRASKPKAPTPAPEPVPVPVPAEASAPKPKRVRAPKPIPVPQGASVEEAAIPVPAPPTPSVPDPLEGLDDLFGAATGEPDPSQPI